MANLIESFLERTKNRLRIQCIGDAMVDEYYDVSVNRISPEFPMPIMRAYSDKPQRRPGGVANVAHQFRHFNVDVQLLCFTDNLLNKVLAEYDLSVVGETALNVQDWGAFIPVKRRFLDGDIQVTRLDVEQGDYGLRNNIHEFCRVANGAQKHSKLPDVAIFSDYDKGYFRSPDEFYLEHCRANGVMTIVDPKYAPLWKWKGCTVFKPNAKEAEELSGRSEWINQTAYFKKELECEAVVITQSGNGVVGQWGNDYFEYRPDNKVDVKSSVGAGDCFVAFLAMAIGYGFEGREAVEIAYEAGAQYVQGNLNRPITAAELSNTKIVRPQDLASRDFTLAFTNGCFDLLHSGHLHTLQFASQKADKLVVALNSDDSVKRLKGPERPVKELSERMSIMAALEMVDFVTYFDEDTPLECIKACKPHALIKGGEYGDGEIVGEDIVPETFRVPMVEGKSTTKLVEKSG